MARVGLRRALGDDELAGYAGKRLALGQKLQHLALAWREAPAGGTPSFLVAPAPIIDFDKTREYEVFAVGNVSGCFYGGVDYPMDVLGLSIGRAITGGYLAGKHAAAL